MSVPVPPGGKPLVVEAETEGEGFDEVLERFAALEDFLGVAWCSECHAYYTDGDHEHAEQKDAAVQGQLRIEEEEPFGT